VKVVVAVRTRNEEANIERFCRAYAWADAILVADGGSLDHTMDLASAFANVTVTEFGERVWSASGLWRNPHGRHINFVIDQAAALDPDWLIFDDCDCVPNAHLRKDARRVFQSASLTSRPDTKSTVFAYRLFLGERETYYPDLNAPGQTLWAWRPSLVTIRAQEENPWVQWMTGIPGTKRRTLLAEPYVLLHRVWPDEATITRKLDFYRRTGEIPNANHPSQFAGRAVPIPTWARE